MEGRSFRAGRQWAAHREQNKRVHTLQIAHAQPDEDRDEVHPRFWRTRRLGLRVVHMLT